MGRSTRRGPGSTGTWFSTTSTVQPAASADFAPVLESSMAPAGRHVLHAYTPANEPWSHWSGLERSTAAYDKQREQRCSVFWQVLEQRIPDLRSRCRIVMEGTPLTHRHFLSVHH